MSVRKKMKECFDRVTVINNNDNIFIIQVFVPCGVITEKDGEYGISHFLEHMKFNKSKSTKVLELKDKISELGGTFNAFTSSDQTSYFIKSTSDQYEECIDLLFELVFNTQFSDNNLENERKVILEERQLTLGKGKKGIAMSGFELINKLMLKKGNPYLRKIIGEKKDLLNISNQVLKRYNDDNYEWSNMKMLINCPKEIERKVKAVIYKMFKKFCKKGNDKDVIKSEIMKMGYHCKNYDKYEYGLIVQNVPVEDKRIIISFKSWSVNDEDFYLLHFIAFLLSNNMNSLLIKELREKQGAVYSIKMINTCFLHMGISSIVFTTTKKDYLGIIHSVLGIIKNELNEGELSKKEYLNMKNIYVRTLKYMFTNNDTTTDYYGNVIFNDVIYSPEELINKMSELDFKTFVCKCNRLFDFEQMGLYVKGNVGKSDDVILKIKKMLRELK